MFVVQPNSTGLCLVSSQHKWNLEELMEEIWNRCNMLRIYTKVSAKTLQLLELNIN